MRSRGIRWGGRSRRALLPEGQRRAPRVVALGFVLGAQMRLLRDIVHRLGAV